MKTNSLLIALVFCLMGSSLLAQGHRLSFDVTFSSEAAKKAKKDGRLFIFLAEDTRGEPRYHTWPRASKKTYIFGENYTDINTSQGIDVTSSVGWYGTPDWTFDNVPAGEYNIQVLWDDDKEESRISAVGLTHSKPRVVTVDKDMKLDFVIDQIIAERKIIEHDLVKFVDLKSDLLSTFWGKPMYVKATVLLPHNYKKGKAYPIRYNVAGYGGRYDRVNRLAGNPRFMEWWNSSEAPQVISVFLDGEGPYGDSYQMDSDNSGPYGESLIKEIIPHIEKKYRGTMDMKGRYVDGCSTGGWVSLGLQLYYPDHFNGAYSYSPDAIDFENYQLTNIYKDKNAYVNEFGHERPIMRDRMGEIMVTTRQFLKNENALGYNDSYTTSGGQFSAHNALYSPKGKDGMPAHIFDPETGMIDPVVAEHWRKYDFKDYAKKNWPTLGPKLQGKIYIWMGDMDNFYLNPGTRGFSEWLETAENPKSDAVIEFTPMAAHCTNYSHRVVLEKIQEKMDKMK